MIYNMHNIAVSVAAGYCMACGALVSTFIIYYCGTKLITKLTGKPKLDDYEYSPNVPCTRKRPLTKDDIYFDKNGRVIFKDLVM